MSVLTLLQRCWHKAVASLRPHGLPNPSKWPLYSVAKQRWEVGSPASADASLQVLQEQNERLRAELSTIRWPPLTSFRLNEKRYTLPLRFARSRFEKDMPKLNVGELAYLTGFFDGDGCVSASCTLKVGQSIDGVATLMRIQQAFGGSIRRLHNGKGLQKPALQWSLGGSSAGCVASLMAPHSIVKRRQLEILAEWPKTPSDKVNCSVDLTMLKRCDSAVAGPCTWAYLAGFFDAEGYIEQVRAGASLRLRMYQKFATVQECVRTFLVKEIGIEARVYQLTGRPGVELRISRTQCCKAVLQKMLDAGLLRKASQAKLALSLTSANADQVRSAMEDTVGNQNFGKRLDVAGLRRAALITHVQQRAGINLRKGQTSQANSLFADVDGLKREHALLNARRVNDQLRAYIDRIQAMHQEHHEYEL